MSDNFENNNFGFDNENSQSDDVFSSQSTESADENGTADTAENVNSSEQKAEQPQPQSTNPYATQNQNYSNGYYSYSQQTNNSQNQYGSFGSQQPQQNQNSYYQFGRQQTQPQQQYSYNRPTPPPQKKSSKGKKAAIAIIVIAVIIGLFAVVISLFSGDGNNNTNAIVPATTTQEQQGNENENTTVGDSVQYGSTEAATQLKQLTAVEVADKARKSVVGVMTYKSGQLAGEGSGVVMGIDADKKYTYIITCAHVINESGATYGVLTLEGKRYDATLVAADSRTDIGVVRVEATDLPVAEFGDSTSLKVGETVYAIGNPGGSEYFGSMTDGIISAIDRSINNTYNMTCIQHNAAINPGNSGGALVNSMGQVIGINSSKIAATDYEGMGFAIPMSIVKPIVDNLIQYGYVPNRPKLGIEYASVNDYQLYSMVVAIKGLPSGSLVIAGISNDSSLANTDAQVGDMIIGVNGKPMDSSDTLLDLINTGNVGDSITLNLCRVENRTYKITKFDVTIQLIEDRGSQEEETTTAQSSGGYNYGGANSFEDFFQDYFGSFGR
ncbi:MAG: trypsin-like peptidase domain-containing protein [Faecalibacterium sp.]|nr:trypsin-like peptidase domain-containing protein [Ruminococcus sp.]MCM1392421.1 trypsin-like peptidase domain-containing protein [Ruminococcus sp.]MCM1486418.1 trypsin-like peptidase domain-containing protein [Faecalibacterium sp.]